MNLYNEIDPFAAAWLGRLGERNLISPGHIETRSISDLVADDVRGATQAHFFAGIGVWSYALRLISWPDDCPIWTGSCPCQPFSTAGRKKGFDDERHLWPAWRSLISECRPSVVVGEQVAGPDGRAWLDLVLADLEELDYAVGASVLPACGVGAPHRRERIYFCALAGDEQLDEPRRRLCRRRESVADYVGPRLEIQREQLAWAWEGPTTERGSKAHDHSLANAQRDDRTRRIGQPHGRPPIEPDRRCYDDDRDRAMGNSGQPRGRGGAFRVPGSQGSREGERIDARHLAHVAQLASANGATRGFWAGADYVACKDPKRGILYRPVEPGTFPLAHGASRRVGRVRGYGNGLVSEAAATFLEAVAQIIEG